VACVHVPSMCEILWEMRLQQNVICNCSYSQSFCTVVWLLCLLRAASSVYISTVICKKVAHTRLPSVGFWSGSRFLAVSLQVTWVINSAVGCHYFPPGLQLPPLPLGGLLPISLFRCLMMGVNSLPKTVTQQRCGFDLNPGPSAPESSMLTTRLPAYHLCDPVYWWQCLFCWPWLWGAIPFSSITVPCLLPLFYPP